MATILTLIISVLIFGLVVMIHELGHFVCAKKAGIQVNEFSIGMGPALFTTVRGGTRYSVRALPIGGYVSMEGEDEELEEPETGDALQELDAAEEEQPKGLPFPKVKVWKRIIVVAAGAIMNLILGFLVLLLMMAFGDPGASKAVGFVEEGSPVQAAGLQVGDEILAVNGHHCFVMNDEYADLEKPFLEYATAHGMVGIKGHRSVGGFRASCYNAQTVEGVQALIQCMKDFEARHAGAR